ncbi:hypothetical protein M514_08385 [Trichuris suis]|uniref:Uncharacterized protein n=1 Tax=Trichuris suis TaxID=68888 RepID=A0A085M0I3_9BILA|nr:hypothetical protein M513_08385 [Trichuris suis]KFD63166.1 hypothetical protein M514_08385 [Trichuris suis]
MQGKQKEEKKRMMMKNQEAHSRQLITAQLSDALQTIEQRLQWHEDSDCNAERSRIAKRDVRDNFKPYK